MGELIYRWIPFASWYIDQKRNPQEGIEYLEWSSKLDGPQEEHPMPSQAHHAREHLALYLWWKNERPARIDPFDFFDRPDLPVQELFNDQVKSEQKTTYLNELRKAGEQEEAFEQEDQDQLIRLMTVRRGLWT